MEFSGFLPPWLILRRAPLLCRDWSSFFSCDGFRRDANWWILVIGPPILVFSVIGWLLFRDRKRRRAEERTRSSERRRSLELTATFRPGDSAADGAFFSIPLDEEKPQFV